MHLHLPHDPTRTTWLVGDVHGAFSRLQDELDARGYSPDTHRLVMVGDLVDRGAESADALAWLQRPDVFAVRGNHEQMCIEFHEGQVDPWLYGVNGGHWAIAMTPYERLPYIEVFRGLPLAITLYTEAGPLAVVHAAVPPGLTWAETLARLDDPGVVNSMLWHRGPMFGVPDVRAVVAGHTVVPSYAVVGNTHMIDTGGWLPRGQGHFTILDAATLEPVRA